MSNQNQNNAPLYVRFAQALRAEIERLGLPEPMAADTETGFPQNEGYFFVEFGPHGAAPALIVPKSKTRMGSLHSHVDLSNLDGHIALPRRNGRVVCHFEPDVTKVSRALPLLVNASKRPIAPPVRRLPTAPGVASQATGPDAPLTVPASPETRLAVASIAASEPYSEEEAAVALQVLQHALPIDQALDEDTVSQHR